MVKRYLGYPCEAHDGWSTSPPETSDVLQLVYGETGTAGLAFTKVQKSLQAHQ